MMSSRFECVPGCGMASSPPAKSIGTGQLSGSTQQTDQNRKDRANHQSQIQHVDNDESKNNNKNILHNNNDAGSYNLKLIWELQKTTKALLSDIQLIHKQLEVDDRTIQIQFRLLRKELDEAKTEAEQRSRLLIALCQHLRPDLDLNTLSMLDTILSGLSTTDEGKKDNDRMQEQQEQQYHFTVEKNEHLIKNVEPSGIKRRITEMEKVLQGLKEDVQELKKREPRRPSSTYDFENSSKDEEEGLRDTLTERIILKEEDELEHHFLPSDTYSYFAVADYFERGRFCIVPNPAFLLASFTLTIQIATLSIFTFDVVDYKNKANPLSVPPGVGTQVRVSQLIALLISCFNQDEVRASFNVLWLGYRKSSVRKINCNATRYKWHFSLLARILLGWFSLIVTFILIINSDTVRDVMLDFAAVTFVSELDNGAFQLSLWGYMGKDIQKLTMKIKNILVYEKDEINVSSGRRRVPRLVWLSFLIGLIVGFWAWITNKQQRGDYLNQSIFVQFGDDFSPVMGAFSGIYEIELDNTIDGMRVNYVERGSGDGSDGNNGGRFLYCSQDKQWLFQYGNEPEGYIEHWFSECWHKARSSQTESYDLTKISDISWFVVDEDLQLENPLQHFLVKGQNDYYGKSCESNDGCGERMYCNEKNQQCVCEDGLFGFNCEFQTPCETLEIDSRDANGFFGTRSWSRRYSSLPEDDKEEEDSSKSTSPIQVYGKPIFVNDESIEGTFDVMIFNGRRWILTDSVSIQDYRTSIGENGNIKDNTDDNNKNTQRNLAEFLAKNFHSYWSNYTFYFVSEPVDVGTPTDSATPVGLQWFRLETTGTNGATIHSGGQMWQGKMSIEANLLCAVCHNKTNPCFYGAICQADGTCHCTTGSSGRICQIPPDNNGNCDVFFNTPEFDFDGGDCCQETCRSTEEYACGNGMIEELGASAYGFVGYPNCQDPRFKYKLSGSTTLYDIIDRGFLRCGSGQHRGFLEISNDGHHSSGFELDLCKAIAAAVLNDPEAIEIVETTWGDRWKDMTEDKFDVLLLRTTHSAERDIFQSGARVGFSFIPIPYFFDGLRYSGIPPYSECADKLDFISTECVDLKICVARGTVWYDTTESLLFPYSVIVEVDNIQEEINGLEAGICNVIAGDVSTFASEYEVRERGFTGPLYNIGKNVHSKDPLTAVVRQHDRVWFKFVSWIFEALVQAEESDITKSVANNIALTDVFGDRFQNMFQNAVAANGNFGEIYEKNLGNKIPRGGLNTINTGRSGLIYSFPFGAIDTHGPNPIVGGAIDTIRKQGILNYGINKAPGFAELNATTRTWRGFEVDMCRGIAAALFHGSPNVNFIPVSAAERFEALADGVVDIVAFATTHTLSREVNEVTTGKGYDFTPIIFYDGLGFGGRPPFVGCAEFLFFSDAGCRGTRICVQKGTTWLDAMMGPLNIPESNVVVTISQEESYDKFVSGECNVIAGESTHVFESTVRGFGLKETEEYVVGVNKFTKEPLAIVSRSDDTQFSDFLRWIIFGFFYAEEQKITRDSYFEMPASSYLFGNGLSGMWQHSIQAVGNYGEIFTRNFDGILERGGQNRLNDNNGPQLYAKPGVMLN